MFGLIKFFFVPSVEEKLFVITRMKEDLIKNIENGKYKFENKERVIEFATKLTEKLNNTYKEKGELSVFESEVLDKVYKDNFYRISFLLLSQLYGDPNKNAITTNLPFKRFYLIEDVGFINTKEIVRYVSVSHFVSTSDTNV